VFTATPGDLVFIPRGMTHRAGRVKHIGGLPIPDGVRRTNAVADRSRAHE
jgi:hypothetical protein